MAKQPKPIVSPADTLEKLDIRVGKIVDVEIETNTRKPMYRMVVDFGKFGKRTSYGRFTQHPVEDVRGRLVLGVLNFKPREMGEVISEVLVLGVQYPKAEGGEATFVSPVMDAKVGSKLF
jgi:tRNA-binding protein